MKHKEFAHCVMSELHNGSCPVKGSGGSSLSPWQVFFHNSISYVRASFPEDLLIIYRLQCPTDRVLTD